MTTSKLNVLELTPAVPARSKANTMTMRATNEVDGDEFQIEFR